MSLVDALVLAAALVPLIVGWSLAGEWMRRAACRRIERRRLPPSIIERAGEPSTLDDDEQTPRRW